MAWNTSSVIVSKKLAAWAAKLVRIYLKMPFWSALLFLICTTSALAKTV
jgi:hypothetical protein